MPYNKQKINKKPELYKVFERKRMGGLEAQSQPLTKETFIHNFASEKSAKDWIRGCTDYNKIYVIRTRDDKMVNSYSYKQSQKTWTPLNQMNYYGGFKIGNPSMPCSCMTCTDTDHPCTKGSNYEFVKL